MHQKKHRSSEQGNVLFYILIAVALLAALSYAVSQSSRGSIASLSKDRARAAATEIIDYGNTVASAVAQLRLRGCSETQISFENQIIAGYINPTSPSDFSCHIFHPKGGGLEWHTVENEWLNPALSGNLLYSEIYYPSSYCIYNVGTNSTTLCTDDGDEELIFQLSWLDAEVCKQINKLIGVENPSDAPPKNIMNTYAGAGLKFVGSYGGPQTIGGDTYTEITGKTTACFEELTVPFTGTYHFYKVLIAR